MKVGEGGLRVGGDLLAQTRVRAMALRVPRLAVECFEEVLVVEEGGEGDAELRRS